MFMTIPPEPPGIMAVRCALGVFELTLDGNNYSGSANSFDLEVETVRKGNGWGYEAFLSDGRGRIAEQSTEGYFSVPGQLPASLSVWIDTVTQEVMEDYQDDVRYLDVPGGRIAYWAYNTHLPGVPSVFVHGGPGGDSNPVRARRMMLDGPVYLFDQTGCGMSSPIEDYDAWDISDYVEQMDILLRNVVKRKAVIIGASWGAAVSLSYSVTHPDMVDGLVLISPFLSTRLWTEDTRQNLASMGDDYLERYERYLTERDYGEGFVQLLKEYNSRYLFSRRIFREYAYASAEEEPNETFRRLNGPNDLVTDGRLKDFDITGLLREVKVPTLLMCGDSDEVTVPRLLQYASMIESPRISVIPHAGHVLSKEQFALYREAVRAFMSENWP